MSFSPNVCKYFSLIFDVAKINYKSFSQALYHSGLQCE